MRRFSPRSTQVALSACVVPGSGAAVNLRANDTGNSGPGPAQVDLPGSEVVAEDLFARDVES